MTTFAQVLDGALRGDAAPRSAPAESSRARQASQAATFAQVQQMLDERLPGRTWTYPRRPRWAVELGVELPCDAQAVRRAFRRRALQTHPDRPGGSHEAFIRSQQALDEALFALSP